MTAGNGARIAGARRRRVGVFALLFTMWSCLGFAGTNYVYDDLGRVIQATDTDGSATVYQYDANGNITSIKRLAASALAISGVSPTSVRAGASLIITGVGFSATAASNTVTIGGATATVTAATTTSLTVTVPLSANSGLVIVTVGTITASSPRTVTVLKPVVSVFTPSIVNPGTAVTVTGASLNLMPGSTSLNVGGTAATITQISNTSITFTAPAASGLIQVVTPYGNATSASSLASLPSSINAANVVSLAAALPGGSSAALNVNQTSKYGVLSFNATQGAFLSVQLSAFTATPGNASIGYQIFSPTNAVIASGNVSATAQSIHLPQIAVAGTYLVSFSSGSATVQLNATVEVNSTFNLSGSLPNVSTSTGQTKRFIITASAGQHVGVGLTNLVMSPSSVGSITVALYRPDGAYIWGRPCYVSDPLSSCGLQFIDLPQTGSYALYATPNGTAAMNFNLTISPPITNALTPGVPQAATNTLPGQFNLMSFTATAGQTVAVHVGSISTTPANVNMYIAIYNPSGVAITNQTTNSNAIFNLTNLAAGTYRVFVVPYFAVTGTAQVTLANGVTGDLPTNGSTSSFSTGAMGQSAYFTFNATAGDDIGFGLTNLVTTPSSVSSAVITVYAPNGSQLAQRTCNTWDPLGSCSTQTVDVPQTGVYKFVVSPNGFAKMNFNLTLSQALTGNLTPGTPFNTPTSVPGQFSLLNFTVGANQPVTVNLGSIATNPANVTTYIAILNSSAANLTNQSTTTGTTFNLNTLAAGTYRVFWVPYYGVTGTSQITLVSNPMPTLSVDGTTSNYGTSVPSQTASFLIPETAGDDIGIGLTNLVTSPSSVGSIDLSLYAPNGSWLWGRSCYKSDPLSSCTISFVDVAQSGNYKLVATPSGAATMNFNLTLSRPLTATLTSGVPQTLAPPLPGQFAWLDFAGTSGHSGSLTIDSMVTSPPNVYTWGGVCDPTDNCFVSNGSPTNLTFNFGLSNGTHHVYWIPYYAVTGSARFSLTIN